MNLAAANSLIDSLSCESAAAAVEGESDSEPVLVESPVLVSLEATAEAASLSGEAYNRWRASLAAKIEALGPTGGSVNRQHSRWSEMFKDSDSQAVDLVKGFRWRWVDDSAPTQRAPMGPWRPAGPRAAEWETAREAIVAKLFERSMVEWVPESELSDPAQWIHTLFCVEKKEKPLTEGRPILNVKIMNKFIQGEKFKMEGISTIKNLVRPGGWQMTFDLTESFHQISVTRPFRRFLRFWAWCDTQKKWRLAQYMVLTMGHTKSPRTLTRLMRAPFGQARRRGVICSRFVDDGWVMDVSIVRARWGMVFLVELLIFLGWQFNLKKTELEPEMLKIYLGFVLDLESFTISYPEDKVAKVLATCKALLAIWKWTPTSPPDARFVSRALGQLMACSEAIYGIRLHLAGLIEALGASLRARSCYADPCPGSEAAMNDLEHWIEHLADWNGKGLWKSKEPSVIIQTDASGYGWGSTTVPDLEGKVCRRRIQGKFADDERNEHINTKEVIGARTGALDTMIHFDLWDEDILIEVDNTVAMSYINKMGGRKFALTALLWPLFAEAARRRNTVTSRHLKGVLNVTADWASREFAQLLEAQLARWIWQTVMSTLSSTPPSVDCFATEENRQTRCFVSRRCLLGTAPLTVDALNTNWERLPAGVLYAFPPLMLVAEMLRKVEESARRTIAIVPAWPTAPWWPIMLRLLDQAPVIIDRQEGVVTTPWNSAHAIELILPWCLLGVSLSPTTSAVEALTRAASLASSITGSTTARITIVAGRSGKPSAAAEACHSTLRQSLTSLTF
jgi:hypothetical protein